MSFNPKIFGADQKAYGQTGGGAPTPVAELIASTVKSRLYSVTAYNAGLANYSLMVFDSATEPADGLAPLMTMLIGPDAVGSFDWQDGIPMSNGVYLCWSTTKSAKTKPGGSIGFILETHRVV